MIADPPQPPATQTILRRLTPLVEKTARGIVVAAVIAARRRTTVEELAQICSCSSETLRYRLHAGGGAPGPSELLGVSTSLHAVWWRGVLGLSPKRTSAEVGQSPIALDHYMRAHAGVRLSADVGPEDFSSLLERTVDELNRCRKVSFLPDGLNPCRPS